ncbi:glycosyltransferase [Belliella marina]|uniref:Glycosyltransferase n=1 Tax=Belliella marina TaxID=1644146 RepID=A0ABW4VQE8_9BACT
MKIIQLVTSRKSRGAEISAQRLSESLIQQGHQVWYVGLYGHPEDLQVDGGVSLDLTGRKSKLDLRLVFGLRKLIKEIKPGIVQANGSDTFKYASLAMIGIQDSKLVYRNISVFSYWIGDRGVLKWIYKLLSYRIDHFVSVGQHAAVDLQKTLGLPKSKSSVIKRGFEIGFSDKVKSRGIVQEKWGLSDDDFILIQVGSLGMEKNIAFSLDVIATLKKELPQVKLLLVGAGAEEEFLRSKSEALAISGHVVFCGHQKEVREMLAGADLLVLTSLVEGIPGVVIEAALQSTPTVAIKIPGTEELVANGISGILVDSYDIAQFADRILALQKDSSWRYQLAENARKMALQEHNEKDNTTQFEALYSSLVNASLK